MRRSYLSLIASISLTALSVFSFADKSSALIIDAMDGAQQAYDPPNALASNASNLKTTRVVGGNRSVLTSKSTATGAFASSLIIGNNFSHSNDALAAGKTTIVWDGDSTVSGINVSGLKGLDLVEDTGTSFLLKNFSFDFGDSLSAKITLTVYDASEATGTKFSSQTKTIGQIILKSSNSDLEFKFLDFIPNPSGSGASFRNVGAIVLEVEANSNADITFSALSTNGNCTSSIPLLVGGNMKTKDDCGICIVNPANINKNKDTCGVCFGGNKDIDSCGACFGKNKAIDDCGVCNGGNLSKDNCGICGGDGRSCIKCTDTDTASITAAMLEKANQQLQNALFFLEPFKKSDPKFYKSQKKQLEAVYAKITSDLRTIPITVKNCEANPFCIQASLSTPQYTTLSNELYQISLKILARPVGPTGGQCRGSIKACKQRQVAANKKQRSLKTLARKLLRESAQVASGVPTTSSICS